MNEKEIQDKILEKKTLSDRTMEKIAEFDYEGAKKLAAMNRKQRRTAMKLNKKKRT